MPGYIWDGSNWRVINGIYAWDGTSNWYSIKNAYAYGPDGTTNWKNIFSSGTFAPQLRSPTTNEIISARSAGLAVQLYKGSTAAGNYAYQFQYALGDQVGWTNESIAGSSGNITGATQTVNFTTDISYVTALEALAYNSTDDSGILDDIDSYRLQEAKQAYIRARVIKSGETQFTNNVRIQKRVPANVSTTLKLRRLVGGAEYTLTGSVSDRSPFPGDTLFWTVNFTNTTTLANDTRPDYYWFSFDSASGPNYKNSILLDPANPRNPINSGRYVVQNSDLGTPIVCNLKAITNNSTGTGDITIPTPNVSDGTLTAPTGLTITYSSGLLRLAWFPALGGNDNTIFYSVSLEREQVVILTSPTQTALTYNYATNVIGNYRFRVTASQAGSTSQTSAYSADFRLEGPLAFTATVSNVTTSAAYAPSVFSINAPTLSNSVLNRWDWTWGVSTVTGPEYAKTGSFNVVSVDSWLSSILRPDGTNTSVTVNSPTDYWSITQSGNHTETVVARNNKRNYVRVSWTKPVGTTAASYSLYISGYYPGSANTPDWNRTINVEDITSVDIEQPYFANGTNYGNSSVIRVNSIRAFSGPNQTGIEQFGTLPAFNFNGADGTTDWSNCNVIGTRTVARTDNLTLEAPTAGVVATNGVFEPGETLSLSQTTNGGVLNSGWSPPYSSWTKTSYRWFKSVTVQPAEVGTSSTVVVANVATAVGSEYFCEVGLSYKGIIETRYSTVASIVPGPPFYSIEDLFNSTFRISNAAANNGLQFFGTYSGVSSGTIPETVVSGGVFTSPPVNVGTISATLFSRRYVTKVYPTTVNGVQVNSTRSTTNNVTIAPPPQSTGSRRFVSNAPSISAGNTFYISTNGYFGNANMPANNYLTSTLPSPGGFLNIAAQDLVMTSCFTKVDSGGTWVRYRGYRYNTPSGPFLEYQAYLTFSGSAYVLFIENGLTDYRGNLAYFVNGVQQNTWSGSSTDTSNFTVNQGTSGWTSRTVTTGTADDGVVSFTVIRPALQHQAGAVTRTAGGFTFQITNVSDNQFESAATYGVSTTAGSASINTSTGLVTQTGLASSAFATVTVSKTRTGYENATNVVVQGQALAGSPPQQVTAPSISASGTTDASGTVRRVQVGGTVSGSAGTYNNQSSITSGLHTILSNSYTGADSNWTSTTPFGTSTPIGNTAASASANMYRWRDRVVGTDGSTVDFYSSVIYRAVYAPPPGNFSTPQQNSVAIQYTGGTGPQRYYRYQNGSELSFITDSGAGPFATTFSGLSPGTTYNIQLFAGNTEGYLSIGFVGGSVTTASAASLLATPSPSASSNLTTGIQISWSPIANAAFYGVWYRGAAPSYDTVPDFGGVANPSLITGSSYLDTSVGSGVTRSYDVQAYPAVGSTTFLKSQYGGPATGTRATTPPPTTPAILSGPNITWASGNNFTLSATASNATNLEFFVEFANNNGGPAVRTQTFFYGASTGGGTTGAQANSWARTRVRANNQTTGLSSAFSAFTGWA